MVTFELFARRVGSWAAIGCRSGGRVGHSDLDGPREGAPDHPKDSSMRLAVIVLSNYVICGLSALPVSTAN